MGKEGRADVLPEPSSGQTVEHGTRSILNMLYSLMFVTLSLILHEIHNGEQIETMQ